MGQAWAPIKSAAGCVPAAPGKAIRSGSTVRARPGNSRTQPRHALYGPLRIHRPGSRLTGMPVGFCVSDAIRQVVSRLAGKRDKTLC